MSLWGGIPLGVSILGIALAIFFYLRGRRVARLSLQRSDVTVLGQPGAAFTNALEIRFEGNLVPRVTSSRLVIWNSGKTTIRRNDLVGADPLRLQVGGDGEILRASIVGATRAVNKFEVGVSSGNVDRALLTFDFLDPADGVTIDVVHSGGRADLEISGTVIGIPSGIRQYRELRTSLPSTTYPRLFVRVAPWVVVVVGLVMIGIGITGSDHAIGKQLGISNGWWGFVIGGAVYMAPGVWMLWQRRRRYPATLNPIEPIEEE